MKRRSVLIMGFLSLLIFAAVGCQIQIDSQAVDANDYLKTRQSDRAIYDEKRTFINPFNFGRSDFGRLILVSIDGHKEIKAVELVVQKNDVGAFVVVYYHDGKVVTHPNQKLSIEKKYLKPNPDWSIADEKAFFYRFEETVTGVLLNLDITIEGGRKIRMDIRENLKEPKTYSFLAAIGADLDPVKRFPFIYLEKAGFIRVENTDATVEIAGETFPLNTVPINVEGHKCYRTVYSFSPLTCFWNEAVSLISLPEIDVSGKEMKIGDAVFFFDTHGKYNAIEKIAYPVEGRTVLFRFSPAFPDLIALKNGAVIDGRFCIGVDDMHGVVCGKYRVSAFGDEVDIEFHPEHCWQPMPGKDWVRSYHYSAEIQTSPSGTFEITSRWRIE